MTPTLTPVFANGAAQLAVLIPQPHTNVVITTTGGGAVGFSNAFDIVNPVQGVIISGPASGKTDATYIFTATVTPPTATLPIIYIWQMTDRPTITNTSGLTNTIPLSWTLTGLKAITVTAMNDGITVSDTWTITIATAETRICYETQYCDIVVPLCFCPAQRRLHPCSVIVELW
jgi:hypothetical protein